MSEPQTIKRCLYKDESGRKCFKFGSYGKKCGVIKFWLCTKKLILIRIVGLILFSFAFMAGSYGVVDLWQRCEDRVEDRSQGSVAGGQWSVEMQKAERLQAEIQDAAEKKELVLAILNCESSSRPDVWGDGGKSYGIAQIQERTWDYLAPKAGIEGDWKDPEDQVALLEWAIDNGYGKHWTCYRKLTEGA